MKNEKIIYLLLFSLIIGFAVFEYRELYYLGLKNGFEQGINNQSRFIYDQVMLYGNYTFSPYTYSDNLNIGDRLIVVKLSDCKSFNHTTLKDLMFK